jgi:hypothetical protein
MDELGSVGHSPAATIKWMGLAKAKGMYAEQYETAQRYLDQATHATRLGITGVYSAPWPINRFEQSFALYAVLAGNLFNHPALTDVLRLQIDDLAHAMSPMGLGMSDYFLTDGDDTAATLTVLEAAGRNPPLSVVEWYDQGDHFSAYPHEFQSSVTVTARFVHALNAKRVDTRTWQRSLVRQQGSDGRWTGDKWNTSWLYATLSVLYALRDSGEHLALRRVYCALLDHQHQDGGWGAGARSNMTETSYGILALQALIAEGYTEEITRAALQRAHEWLMNQYLVTPNATDKCWISKDLYRPHRIDQAFILSALLSPFELRTHTANVQTSRETQSTGAA